MVRRATFAPYHLERVGDQYELTFEGKWHEVMLWEIPALAILMELRGRAVLDQMGKFELQILYARAMTRVWEKSKIYVTLKAYPSLILEPAAVIPTYGKTGVPKRCVRDWAASFQAPQIAKSQ